MRQFFKFVCLLVTVLSINLNCKAAIITAITDGAAWNNITAWDLGRIPSCGDTIIVPTGIDLRITTNVDLDNGDPSCSAVRISIGGSIAFSNGKKIRLAAGACMTVENGGRVRQSFNGGGSSESISIDGTIVWKAADGNLVGPASMGCPVVLPVTLISFMIKQDPQSYSLFWNVAEEKNLAFYEIFISQNGYDWESIHTQTGMGNTTIEQKYDFRYVSPLNPNENSYFKLQSTDFDGKVNVLAIETSTLNLAEIFNENELTVYPNPCLTQGILNLAFQANTKNDIMVEITDLKGQIIFQKFDSCQKGQNLILIETTDFQKGNYILKVKSEEINLIEKIVLL